MLWPMYLTPPRCRVLNTKINKEKNKWWQFGQTLGAWQEPRVKPSRAELSRAESGWSWCQFDGHHLDWLSNACQQQFSATISNTFSAKCHKTIEIESERGVQREMRCCIENRTGRQTNRQMDIHSSRPARQVRQERHGERLRGDLEESGFSDVVSVEPEPRQRLRPARLGRGWLSACLPGCLPGSHS